MEERPEPIGPARDSGSTMIWIILGAAAFVAFVWLFSRGAGPGGDEHPAVGQTLYVSADPLTGEGGNVSTDRLQGKVSVVNFWGPWCPPCLAEMPHLAELAEKYQDEPRFQWLPITCSQKWSPNAGDKFGWREDVESLKANVESYLAHAELSDWPTYVDTQGRSRDALAKACDGQVAYPTTALVDGNGVVHRFWVGFTPEAKDELELAVRGLLRE